MEKPVMWIVRVYDGQETYEYEYGNEKHASEQLDWERENGNSASLFAYYWNGINSREEFVR